MASDLVYSHSALGLTNDYRHGQHTCTYCHISKKQMKTRFLENKPAMQTSTTMQECLTTFNNTGSILESKGVVSAPILPIEPMKVMFPYVHVFKGVWQKIWDFGTDHLVKILDAPYIGRTPQARQLNERIMELDKQQQTKVAALAYLETELVRLKTEHANLSTYLQKLQKGVRFPKLRESIKEAQSDIRKNGKQQQEVKNEIQQLNWLVGCQFVFAKLYVILAWS